MDNFTDKTLTLVSEECKLNIYGSTFIGTRDYQQDRMLIYESENLSAAIVCDGMGGMTDGEKASQFAVDSFAKVLKRLNGTEKIKDFLCREAYEINNQIASFRDENGRPVKSGTTIVMTVVVDNEMHIISAGDSRIYIVRGGRMRQLTQDHNYMLRLNEQLKLGIIDEKKYEAERPRAEALISFLGVGEPIIIDANGPYRLFKGDVIILCSDGLYKGLSNEEIERIVNENMYNVQKVPDSLIAASRANMSRGMDNTTVIAMEYNTI